MPKTPCPEWHCPLLFNSLLLQLLCYIKEGNISLFPIRVIFCRIFLSEYPCKSSRSAQIVLEMSSSFFQKDIDIKQTLLVIFRLRQAADIRRTSLEEEHLSLGTRRVVATQKLTASQNAHDTLARQLADNETYVQLNNMEKKVST